jgi:hypothetical protein
MINNRKRNMKKNGQKAIDVVRIAISGSLLLYLLLSARPSFSESRKAPEISSKAQVESLLATSQQNVAFLYSDRHNAIVSIKLLPNLDTIWAVNTIVNNIKNETAIPMPFGYPGKSYLTYSQSILRQDVFALAKLGSPAWPAILERRNSLNGESRDWVTISLGYQGADTVHNDIRNIFRNSVNPNLKAMAAACLGIYKDKGDAVLLIPEFESSFRNASFINADSMGYKPYTPTNIVWATVASALTSLGYKVEWDSLAQQYRLEK